MTVLSFSAAESRYSDVIRWYYDTQNGDRSKQICEAIRQVYLSGMNQMPAAVIQYDMMPVGETHLEREELNLGVELDFEAKLDALDSLDIAEL